MHRGHGRSSPPVYLGHGGLRRYGGGFTGGGGYSGGGYGGGKVAHSNECCCGIF